MATNTTLYITGLGKLLNQITCAHVIIASYNMLYSHDFSNPEKIIATNKSFTVYRSLWPNNTVSDRYYDAQSQYGSTEIEQNVFGSKLYSKSLCMYTLILSSQRSFLWKPNGQYYTFQPIHAVLYNQWHCLSSGAINLPTLFLDLLAPNISPITVSEALSYQNATGNFNNFFGILPCYLEYMSISGGYRIAQFLFLYFCTYFLPTPVYVASSEMLPINLLDMSAFTELVHKIGSAKVWIFMPTYHNSDSASVPEYESIKNIFHMPKQSMTQFPSNYQNAYIRIQK